MADYTVKTIPLDAVFTDRMLVSPGTEVAHITVQSLPAPVAGKVWLRIGEDGERIPLWLMGQVLGSNPPEKLGVYLDNPQALPGYEIVLLVGFTVFTAGT